MARQKICGIYKITNLITNKVYIGQAVDIKNRWACHRNHIQEKRTALQCAMYRYGIENFKFEILETCPRQQLNDLEIKYIQLYNSYIYSENSNGYNMTTGGDSAFERRVSEETKQKIRKALTGRKIHISEEGLQRRRQASKDIRHDVVVCNNIEYHSVSEFARVHNLINNTVRCWLAGRLKMPGEWYDKNLHYKYKHNNIIRRQDNYKSNSCTPIIYNNIIYDSKKDCAKALGVHVVTLNRWLNGTHNMPKHVKQAGLSLYKE